MGETRPIAIDQDLISEAETLGIDVVEADLRRRVRALHDARRRMERLQPEDFAAIKAWNGWIDDRGMPLEGFRPW